MDGRIDESQRLLLYLGRKRFGPPDTAIEEDLRAIRDLNRLERLAEAMLTALSWQALLTTP